MAAPEKTYRFEPNDPYVAFFLSYILQLPESVTDDGDLTPSEQKTYGINSRSLETVMFIHDPDDGDSDDKTTISSYRADRILKLQNEDDFSLSSLFRNDNWHGVNSRTAETILINILSGVGLNPNAPVIPEMADSFAVSSYTYGKNRLRGVNFSEEMAPSNITQYGPSIIRIGASNRSGSGVIISEDGLVLTARHVLYDHFRDGASGKVFVEDIFADIDGKHIPITKGDVVWDGYDVDAECKNDEGAICKPLDMILIKLPALAGRKPLLVAEHLPETQPWWSGDGVWAIGFPGAIDQSGNYTRSMRLYTYGKITGVHYGETACELSTSVILYHGYSGGALINERGELLGISSSVHDDNWERDIEDSMSQVISPLCRDNYTRRHLELDRNYPDFLDTFWNGIRSVF